jgi:rhamnose utilization protein RhaD (predicted bifunctional aldolase and dehydrogenase)/NAD(P)-dependent dehydrogenase (short-subunit alcohol dehydrogenase family)
MEDRWLESDARAAVARWPELDPALALRTWSARLIGQEPALVVHGGGNTSVKGRSVDLLGRSIEVLWVKGSGGDLASIGPNGHVAVDLAFLRSLRSLTALSDEAMVNALRTHQLDASAAVPSIETLLHAFVPPRYVDHSHADAILALVNRADGAGVVARALGARVAVVPYVKAGFDLAKAAALVYDENPGVEGLVLLHHGLFTFGDTAEESYRRHVSLVSAAEAWLGVPSPRRASRPAAEARTAAAGLAPLLRRALSTGLGDGAFTRWVLDLRQTDEVRAWAESPDLEPLALAGPLTPDHVIRTKPLPLVVAPDDDLTAAVARYRASYDDYFARHAAGQRRLDSTPRVVWVAGIGLFGVGRNPTEAAVAADIAEHTHRTKVIGLPHGPYVALSQSELFEMEYWSLEQAKLGKSPEPLLQRRVALVTGAGGAIGFGVARALLEAGACVVLGDVDTGALERAVAELGGGNRVAAVYMDVTSTGSVESAFEAAALAFGGVDLVVANAGVAATGSLATLSEAEFRRVTEVNLHGTFLTLSAASRWLVAQGTGGQVIVVSTKNVFEPGAEFGAYSASKAGAHQLARVAALELAPHGVRVNLVAPDAVFSEGPVQSGLWATVGPGRAAAKGVPTSDLPEHYRRKNLLQARVTGRHVGSAVVFLASEATPTTGAVLPVDGGLPGAFPR